MIYTSKTDLIANEITTALGEYAASFDVDGLVTELEARDLLVYRTFAGQAQDNGFELVATPDEFWALAAQFDVETDR